MGKYIKCSELIHKRLKTRSAELGQDMQVLAEGALLAYLDSDALVPPPAHLGSTRVPVELQDNAEYTHQLSEVERKLELILGEVQKYGQVILANADRGSVESRIKEAAERLARIEKGAASAKGGRGAVGKGKRAADKGAPRKVG